MRFGLAAAILLALVASPALAGTERAPELSDPADQPRKSADILAVWLEDHPKGVRFTFKLADVRAPVERQLYEIGFRIGLSEESVAVGWDLDGRLHSSVDTPSLWGRSPSAVDDALLEETFRSGAPAYVSAVIPWGAVEGLEPGARMSAISARSAFWDGNQWVLRYDEMGGGLLGASFTPVAGAKPLLPPAFALAAATLAGAAAGGFAFRAMRRRARKPAAPEPRRLEVTQPPRLATRPGEPPRPR